MHAARLSQTRLPRVEPVHLVGCTVDGRYRMDRLLGEGGMGHVFGGVRLEDDHPVAIKVLRQQLVDNEGETLRFEREVDTLRNLDAHPNIVEFYDAGRALSGEPALVTELLTGKTVYEIIGKRRRLAPHLVVQIARQALNGLAHVHEHGVVHRDVKPSNIFLTRNPDGTGCVKLIDFGLALEPGSADVRLTMEGRVVGTVWYLAPEQVARRRITGAADVYSMGVVLYRALAGFHPIDEKGPARTLVAHLRVPPKRVDWEAIEVPAGLGRLVMECLRKDPRDRPGDAATLRDELARWA